LGDCKNTKRASKAREKLITLTNDNNIHDHIKQFPLYIYMIIGDGRKILTMNAVLSWFLSERRKKTFYLILKVKEIFFVMNHN
jgi:hypothetical protein